MVHRFKGKQLKDNQINDIVGVENSKDTLPPDPPLPLSLPLPSPNNEVEIPELEFFSEDEEGSDSESRAKKAPKKKSSLRQRWSKEEEGELLSLFSRCFTEDRCPGQKEIEEQMKRSKRKDGLIHKRPRDNIKKKVSGMRVKKRKEKVKLICS